MIGLLSGLLVAAISKLSEIAHGLLFDIPFDSHLSATGVISWQRTLLVPVLGGIVLAAIGVFFARKGWAEANDYIIANSNEAMETLQKAHYSQTPLADINESFKAQKMFTSRDWKRLYSDGTVTNWLQQSTDFFMANAGIKDFTPASKYFDPSLYLKTIA